MHILTRGTLRSLRGDDSKASAGPHPLYVCGGKKRTLRKLNTHPYWRGMRKPPPILRWRSFANPYHSYAGGPLKSTAEARFLIPRKMPCTPRLFSIFPWDFFSFRRFFSSIFIPESPGGGKLRIGDFVVASPPNLLSEILLLATRTNELQGIRKEMSLQALDFLS